MKRILNYKAGALLLATIFCLFNVGLPVVIASCPMTTGKSSALLCCVAKPNADFPAVNKLKSTDCCKTTIAAEHNTTEFLQGGNSSVEFACTTIPLLQSIIVAQPVQVLFAVRQYSPSPPSEDIPVFISSLLI